MEKIITLSVTGQDLTAEKIETVNATVGLIYCEFMFDQSWNDYPAKLANFKRDNQPMSEAVTVPIVNNRCRVPDELLRYKGCIYVAVQGENTEGQTERTAPAHIIKQTQTITDGRNAIDPTPDQYAQFIEQVQEIIDAKGYVTIEELQEQLDPINAALTKKVERVRLQCSDSLIWDEEGNALTYDEVLELMLDITKYITLTYADSISLQPHGWDGNAVFFMSSYIIGNAAYIDRFIIDSENHCKFTEEELALAKNVPAPYDDTQIRADIEAIDTDLNDVKENLSELDSSKADKSELDGKVDDVEINGRSVVADGVANIPVASNGTYGVSKLSGYYLFTTDSDGRVCCAADTYQGYLGDSVRAFISKGTLENVLAERLKEPQFELIEEIVLTSDSAVTERTAEPNGVPYNFKSLLLEIYNTESSTASLTKTVQINRIGVISMIAVNGTRKGRLLAEIKGGKLFGHMLNNSAYGGTSYSLNSSEWLMGYYDAQSITHWRINDLPANTHVNVWGIRA